MSFEHCEHIREIMFDFNKPWFLAGGWAIDLFLERQTRIHQDIDVALYRKDQRLLKEYLEGWNFYKVINGKISRWENEYLSLPIHEIQAHNQNGIKVEFLLNESDNDNWIFRKEQSITYNLQKVWSYSTFGIPYLNPEIVLLYKTNHTRLKDHKDFEMVKEYLKNDSKIWLRNAIRKYKPEHEWYKQLR